MCCLKPIRWKPDRFHTHLTLGRSALHHYKLYKNRRDNDGTYTIEHQYTGFGKPHTEKGHVSEAAAKEWAWKHYCKEMEPYLNNICSCSSVDRANP